MKEGISVEGPELVLLLMQVLDGRHWAYPEQNQQALTDGDLMDASAHWACIGGAQDHAWPGGTQAIETTVTEATGVYGAQTNLGASLPPCLLQDRQWSPS